MLVLDLIYSVVINTDIATLFKVKSDFLQQKDRPYLEFVKDFYSQYSKLPDVPTVEQKFNIRLSPNNEKPTYWYDEIVLKYQGYVVEQAVISAAKSKSKAIDIFQEAIVNHNVDIDGQVITHNAQRRKDRYKEVKGTGGITYYSTGDDEFDKFSLGYKRADLWTIGGSEGSGKTWLLLRMANWLDEMFFDKGIIRNILFFSCEMDGEEIEDRLDCIRTGLAYGKFSKGELSPLEERRYNNYLATLDTRIHIIDNFDGMKDIEFYMTVYNPAAVYIDGSHLLASSYEWTDIARVTADMKRLTRNKKTPIINTTHLKAEKGKDGSGGSLDDFAYSKGYTRDSDIAGVIFKNDEMELENKFGLDWVKIRRGTRTRMIFEQDFTTMEFKLHETLAGQMLAAAKMTKHHHKGAGGTVAPNTSGSLALHTP